jgi:hypothetical protein
VLSEAKQRSAHLRLVPSQRAPFGGNQKQDQEQKAIAIFHASTKPISRSTGRSSVAAAAYRSGSELVDMRTGLIHDYTRKGGVVSTEIILPDGGSAERNALWNAAEAAENRKDSRTAREWIIALPAELDEGQRQELATSFGIELATRYGVAVDVAIHLPDREGDNRNHHAHVLTTTRQVSRDARGVPVMGDKASIELSDTKRRAQGMGAGADEVLAIRQLWERMANGALEKAGSAARIDSRSLKAQGLDREATTHLGPVATDMERRHKSSDRGDGNRQVATNNVQRAQTSAQILDLTAYRSAKEAKKPTQDPAGRKARTKLPDNPLPVHARNPHRMGTLADISARSERLFGPMKEPGEKDQVDDELFIDRAQIMEKLGYQVQAVPAPEITDDQVNQVETSSIKKPWSKHPSREAAEPPAKPAPAVGQPLEIADSPVSTPKPWTKNPLREVKAADQPPETTDKPVASSAQPVDVPPVVTPPQPKLTGSAAIRARIAEFKPSDQPVLGVRERMTAAMDKLAGRLGTEPKPAPGREVVEAQTESQRIAGLSIDTLKAEIEALTPAPADRDPNVMALGAEIAALRKQQSACRSEMDEAQRQLAQWRRENPKRAKLHDSGLFKNDLLTQGAAFLEEHQGELSGIKAQLMHAETRMLFAQGEARTKAAQQLRHVRPQIERLEGALRERLLADTSAKPPVPVVGAQETPEGQTEAPSQPSPQRTRSKPVKPATYDRHYGPKPDRDGPEPGMD